MNTQDWEPVVFSKKPKPIIKHKENVHTNDDDVPIPAKKISTKEHITMMKSRINHGYKTQKDLATATRGKIHVNRINEIENGKGIAPTGQEKTILFNLLKIKFN